VISSGRYGAPCELVVSVVVVAVMQTLALVVVAVFGFEVDRVLA
jgi:hypothetical protein